MGEKKKKGNKGKFFSVLKENAKKILVKSGEEEKTLQEMTNFSLENMVTTQFEGIVPVSASEAAENSIPGESTLTIVPSYANVVFTVYESALKNSSIKQTMLVQVPASEMEAILDGEMDEGYESLFNHTNLRYIMDNISEKRRAKMLKWADAGANNPDIFVIKIPDVIFFYDSIKKNECSKSKIFDMVFVFLRTDKSMRKLLKKDKQLFTEISDWYIEKTVGLIEDLGISSGHIPLDDNFFENARVCATSWAKYLSKLNSKTINRLVFCTTDSDMLVTFQNQMKEELATSSSAIKLI